MFSCCVTLQRAASRQRHIQLLGELSAHSSRTRPWRPWRAGRIRFYLRRDLRRLSAPSCDAAHPREPH